MFLVSLPVFADQTGHKRNFQLASFCYFSKHSAFLWIFFFTKGNLKKKGEEAPRQRGVRNNTFVWSVGRTREKEKE